MTMQRAELLFYDGAWQSLHSLPLEPYFELVGTRPNFTRFLSSVGRGYVGCWAVVERRLYLTELQQLGFEKRPDGSVSPGMVADPALLSAMFPDQDAPIFADWYSGELRCPVGEIVATGRGKFGDLYERYQVMSVERGVVVHENVIVSIERVSTTEKSSCEETAPEQEARTVNFQKWLNRLVKTVTQEM